MKHVLRLALLTLVSAALTSAEFVWVGGSSSTWEASINWISGPDLANLSTASTPPGASDRVYFRGTTTHGCVISSDVTVAAIISDFADPYTNSLGDDGLGRKITITGSGFDMRSGTLSFTGPGTQIVIASTGVNSLGVPPNQQLPILTIEDATAWTQLETPVQIAGTFTANGTLAFNASTTAKPLIFAGAGKTHDLSAATLVNIYDGEGNVALIRVTGSGTTLILNGGSNVDFANDIPSLDIKANTTIQTNGSPGYIRIIDTTSSNFSIDSGIELVLDASTALVVPPGVPTGYGDSCAISGDGVFVWDGRPGTDFPTPGAVSISCSVLFTGSGVYAIPEGWTFGPVTFSNAVESSLTISLQGNVHASSFLFAGQNYGSVTLEFLSDAALIATNGGISESFDPSFSELHFLAIAGPVDLRASESIILSTPSDAGSFTITPSSLGLVLTAGGDITCSGPEISSGSLAAVFTDGASDKNADLPNGTWQLTRQSTSTAGSTITITSSSPIRVESLSLTGDGSHSFGFSNSEGTMQLTDGATITRASSSSAGQLTISGILQLEGALELAADGAPISLFNAEVNETAPTLGVITTTGGYVVYLGQDNRLADTIVNGDGQSIQPRAVSTAAQTNFILTGYDAGISISGAISSVTTTNGQPGFIWSGLSTTSVSNLDLSQGNGQNPHRIGISARTTATFDGTPGSDYTRMSITSSVFLSSNVRLEMLWSGNGTPAPGRLEGVLRFPTSYPATPGPLFLPTVLNSLSGTTVTWEWDAANKEVDLVIGGGGDPGPTTSVGAPARIALIRSTGRDTIWNAVCPGTAEGLARLRADLAGKSETDVIAYLWDTTTQQFVTYPNEPVGGIQPWHGWFIATRDDLSIEGQGTSQSVVIQPIVSGWTFAGFQPVSAGDVVIYDHNLADLTVKAGGSTVADASTVIGTAIVRWTGSGYASTNRFISGRAYWIYNATDGSVSETLERDGATFVPKPTPSSGAVVPPPPMPPGFRNSTNDTSGGCGGGSAAAFLVFALIGLTRRSHRRQP